MSTTCRSCNAPIFWAVTSLGERIPIDVAPVPNGNLVGRAQAGDAGALDELLLVISVATAEKMAKHGHYLDPNEPRFVSHFATCPQSGKWRRK